MRSIALSLSRSSSLPPRSDRSAFAVLLLAIASAAAAAAACATTGEVPLPASADGAPGGKADAPTVASNDACRARHPDDPELRLKNAVGCEMWELIDARHWGAMHYDFHTYRR